MNLHDSNSYKNNNMILIKNFILNTLLCFSVIFFIDSAISSELPEVNVLPAAQWIEPARFTDEKIKNMSNIIGGQHYLLFDNQVNVTAKKAGYMHFAIKFLNENAVEKNSRITVNFDPSFQSLVFHKVIIWRNGIAIKQSIKNKIKLLQREKDLENLIYDGRWSATLLLDDVKKNDILEYSYTVTGQNPAYQDHISDHVYLQWADPIKHQFYRLLWPNKKPIKITTTNTIRKELKIVKKKGYKEYKIERFEFPTLHIDSEAPSWFEPSDYISFSSITKWTQTVDWALPFYKVSKKSINDVEPIVSTIRNKYSSKIEQASAALRYVQDEIRYVGIEVGVGGFIPSEPGTTLKRLYGDCKDKTFLLISMLKSLNIEAYPVLAHTSYGAKLDEYGPKLSSFNHVLVKVILNKDEYWLETTTNNQASTLDKIFQPDYGLALLLKLGTDSLVSMHKSQPYHRVILNEKFDLTSGLNKHALYTVDTVKVGSKAESFRRSLNSSGKNKLAKQYLDYYTKTYKNIESIAEVKITDNKALNVLTVTEKYKIPNFWQKNDHEYSVNFYNDDIRSYLTKPKVQNRNSPYKFYYPVNYEHNITIKLPATWDLNNSVDKLKTKFFNFEREIIFDEKETRLQLNYKFKTLKKYIKASEISEYLEAIDKIEVFLDYGLTIERDNNADVADNNWLTEFNIYLLFGLTVLILFIFSLIEFLINQKRAPVDTSIKFYPVATSKLFILSVGTFGLYMVYWFYKNWCYVKMREQSRIIPWGRALFYNFWYYPFYNSIKRDDAFSNVIYSKMQNFRHALIAIAFFILSLLSNREHLLSYVAIILLPLCILPLVEKINHLTETSNESYVHNSKWRIRHFIFIFLMLFITLIDVSTRINFIPNESVVKGDSLWQRDIKYMHRIGVLSPNEKLLLFYSDSSFTFKDDGNGITNSGVFSYWRDEGSTKLNTAVSKFHDIADIEYSNLKDDASSIKIIRTDGSSFVVFVQNTKKLNFNKLLKKKWEASKSSQSLKK